jgi:hypothetical protein
MNEQLQLAVSDILTKSMSALDQGAEFMAGEIPEVIEQLLMWKAFESLSVTVMLISFSMLSIFICTKLRAKAFSDFDSGESWATNQYGSEKHISSDADFVASLVWWVPAIATIPIFVNLFSAPSWLQIWIAPKLYLLEYAASIIK